jgi:hypothetical protein
MNKKTIQPNTFKSPGTHQMSKIDLGKTVVNRKLVFTQCTVEIKIQVRIKCLKLVFDALNELLM